MLPPQHRTMLVSSGQDPLYPTRTQPIHLAMVRPSTALAADSSGAAVLETGQLLARIVGRDPEAGRPLTDSERGSLQDPFAKFVIGRNRFPKTLDETLAALSDLDGTADALSRQMVFVVSETGQIRWSEATSSLPRSVRYVIARGRPNGSGAELLISTRPPSSNQEAFLQIAAWDPANSVFHFYERIANTWFWKGNSWHSLSEPTRGGGPFDSHVNG